MPPESKSYQSLSTQVAERIAQEIRRQTWVGLLPSERTLTDTLQVSRKTLRKALTQRQQEGLIETTHRVGRRIKAKVSRAKRQEISVGLLTPESLEHLSSNTAMCVGELRAMLFERGVRLATFSGRSFFTQSPENALTQLVRQTPQTCWVLTHSNERMQRSLFEQQVPTLVAGSSYHGVQLPSVDPDYFAVCRHAAGVTLRHGHRRLALLITESQRAGDIESEAGFVDGVRSSSHADAESIVIRHDGTVAGASRMLARHFNRPAPPTALLIMKPIFYLTAFAFLAQRGLQVPDDVSLVSRDSDTFLPYLTPTPAYYLLSPKTYAKRLFALVMTLIRGAKIAHPQQRIEPRFIPGPSLGPPRLVA
ncbi:MAG: LacI family DNA-binding transcriptional regulator [Verrucomicrobia bacterium]|nr:LacI family DNA-binding transcriptional regulator [Verrucomicrobiota bacterium]